MGLESLPDPPAPPEAPRRIRLYRYQWVGLAFLSLLPILALAGVFGETWATARFAGRGLEVDVRYPERYRYKQLNSVEVWLRNTSGATLDTVTVALDTAVANRFSTVRSIPSFTRPYRVEVTDVAAGETRLVLIELQGERYGRHAGALTVEGPDTLRIPLAIRIFP